MIRPGPDAQAAFTVRRIKLVLPIFGETEQPLYETERNSPAVRMATLKSNTESTRDVESWRRPLVFSAVDTCRFKQNAPNCVGYE